MAMTALPGSRWRRILRLFRINPRRMTVGRLGLGVNNPSNVERVDAILWHFLSGFNETITAGSCARAAAYCDSLPVLFQPFAHEGLAMGYTLHHLFRYDARAFERTVVNPKPEFRYLYYVGLGFWWGMRNVEPSRVEQLVQGLDPMHRYLCFDGYGFKVAFFDLPQNPGALKRLDAFTGYARNAAYQGVGRAVYFLHMDEPDALIARVSALGDHAPDAAAGVGLAMSFVNPDRLDRAFAQAGQMPMNWHSHVHLGLCFGLKARSINHAEQFEADLARYDEAVQLAVRFAIRECDRVELLTRADGQADGYRRWREAVTSWLERHTQYPMARVNRVSHSGAKPLPRSAHELEPCVPSESGS
jgi:hypothetical protein